MESNKDSDKMGRKPTEYPTFKRLSVSEAEAKAEEKSKDGKEKSGGADHGSGQPKNGV